VVGRSLPENEWSKSPHEKIVNTSGGMEVDDSFADMPSLFLCEVFGAIRVCT